jgi:uncharacterized protein YyaL (SSP411 family)
MTNRLIGENSPYLLQHAENPVNWFPWGEDALSKAQEEDKPIFLSIGYAACHWCHVMAHESFEDPETARLMNDNFINIKVDREERPDLDNIYMNAVTAMTGQGGWPMSVFLTPDKKPFYGGTYFPPVRRFNMPSFKEVLLTVARLWREDRERVLQSSDEITAHLHKSHTLKSSDRTLNMELLDQATLRLVQSYDWENGGWGNAPKFPQPMAIEFLLMRAVCGDTLALDTAKHALNAMAKGGMYDIVGGGFSRYSTDSKWLVPHFEKMLYDNAQLAICYLHAYLISGEKHFRLVCEDTLDFLLREMTATGNGSPSGGLYSSLDADSEGDEGKFYLWTPEQITRVLNGSQNADKTIKRDFNHADIFIEAFNVTEDGNFEGRTVLQRVMSDQELAQRFSLDPKKVPKLLGEMRAKLLKARNQRVRPESDDKVLVSWNSLALRAFAEAARYLDRGDYLEFGKNLANFLLTELHPDQRLLRSWRAGKAQHNAYLEDYAALILGLIALYQSDPSPRWFVEALLLAEELKENFTDPNGGFYDTRIDHDPLLLRPKEIQDNATPSGNSMAAIALLKLALYTGDGEWRDWAERSLGGVLEFVEKYPLAFSKWLCAIYLAVGPVLEVAIIGDPNQSGMKDLIDELWSKLRPFFLAAISSYPPHPDSPPLLHGRPLLNDLPTAYVCQQFVCQNPVNFTDELTNQLENAYTN